MSMQTTRRKTLKERIRELGEKAEKATQLNEEARQIKHRREKARQKDSAFADLQRELSFTVEQLQSTKQWIDIAEELGVKTETRLDSDVVERIQRNADEFATRPYDDFDDPEEVKQIRDQIETERKELQEETKNIRDAAQEQASDLLESVLQKETLLKIPDIGTRKDEQVCDDLKVTLKSIRRDEVTAETPSIYRDRRDAYDALEISLDEYDLTDEAEDVIWQLLDDETVTLADIGEDVLEDLQSLEEFSNKLSVQFTS